MRKRSPVKVGMEGKTVISGRMGRRQGIRSGNA